MTQAFTHNELQVIRREIQKAIEPYLDLMAKIDLLTSRGGMTLDGDIEKQFQLDLENFLNGTSSISKMTPRTNSKR